jgi:small subunit ribosomal protein S20
MARHKSAAKRARQEEKRRTRNRGVRSRVKNAVKKLRTTLESGDAEQSALALREAEGMLRRAASRGVIPKQRASRQISRLARRAHRASTAKA